MERRVFVAILLSFAVLYGYQALFVPPKPAPPAELAQRPQPVATSSETPAIKPAEAVPESARAPEPPALMTEAGEREIVVDTATSQVVLTNRGGRILHWRLKDYRDPQGALVDLVPSDVPPDQPRPFSLLVDDQQITTRLNGALFQATGDSSGRVDASQGPGTVVFEYQDAAGLRARKEFRFDPRNYVVSFSATVTNGEKVLNPTIAWGPGLGDAGAATGGGSFFTGNYVQPPQAIYHRDGDVERITAGDTIEEPIYEGVFRFAGLDDHYFLAAAVNPGRARLEYKPVTLPGPGETQRQLLAHAIRFPEPPATVRFFVGPKQLDVLRSVEPEMARAISFGMFRLLSLPLLSALTWIHGFIGNYGWAIILLTILINLAIFPLRHKSLVSMRKVQALQPQLKLIQDRYAGLKVTDPAKQKMQTEIMALYKEKGVNPASGCLPMLLTMPVLFAFYSLLSQAIELRGAEFGWWIKDLSEHDPLYITPVLMALTMFWQQKVTPSTADPAQQKVMMMMPLMFGVMFLYAPSGLVLYWFVGNLFAIGQQYFTNWWIGPPVVATARPPAERRLKNAGSGRTAGAENKN
ncbi:MAG TPA: membrane protein insertase YidC [Vicinamibacterales bacterium]|nr:membrane protein insertase YidC [Vicinamibacterales bacterium]